MGCCFGKPSREDRYRLPDNEYNDPAFNNTGGGFGNTGGGGAIGNTNFSAIGNTGGGFGNTTGGGFGNTAFGSGGPAPNQGGYQPPVGRQRLDPKDFMWMQRTGETLVKEPGSVDGQQFIIDGCVDCDLWIFDHNAAITIDDCKNCRIFIGPCDSSVFIRDCYDCKCVFMCRQFRTRTCEDCDFQLYCATRPVIETSKRLRFGCIDFTYEGEEKHMAATKMSKFTNYWSNIHDFTKAPGNWSFLPPQTRAQDLVAPLPKAACLPAGGTPARAPFFLKTWGEQKPPSHEMAFVLLPPGPDQAAKAETMLAQMHAAGMTLVHTNMVKLDHDTAKQLMGEATEHEVRGSAQTLARALVKDKSIGLEWNGTGVMRVAESLLPPGELVCTSSTMCSGMFRYMGIEG